MCFREERFGRALAVPERSIGERRPVPKLGPFEIDVLGVYRSSSPTAAFHNSSGIKRPCGFDLHDSNCFSTSESPAFLERIDLTSLMDLCAQITDPT